MSEEALIGIAGKYNLALDEFIRKHNEGKKQGMPEYVHNAAVPEELKALADSGYKIEVQPVDPSLRCAYDESPVMQKWVEGVLYAGNKDFLRYDEPMQGRWVTMMAHILDTGYFKRSVAVAGRNDENKFIEFHLMSKEALVPRFFDALYVVTAGFASTDSHEVNISNARLVWLPAESMYVLDKRVGHHLPKVLGVVEVFNTVRVGGPLEEFEKGYNKDEGEKVFLSGDTVLATSVDTEETAVRLKGTTPVTGIIHEIQQMADMTARHDLEEMFR